MKITDLREYKLVGTFGDAKRFKEDYNHIMTAFSGSGYTIAVHTVDEDLYKLSDIKHDKIKASFENGLLTIIIPKESYMEIEKSKSIEIN